MPENRNYLFIVRTAKALEVAKALNINPSLHQEFIDVVEESDEELLVFSGILYEEVVTALDKFLTQDFTYEDIKEFYNRTGINILVIHSFEGRELYSYTIRRDYVDAQGLYPDENYPEWSERQGDYLEFDSLEPIKGDIVIFRYDKEFE